MYITWIYLWLDVIIVVGFRNWTTAPVCVGRAPHYKLLRKAMQLYYDRQSNWCQAWRFWPFSNAPFSSTKLFKISSIREDNLVAARNEFP